MNSREAITFLRNNVELFQGFTDDDLKALVNASRLVTFEADEAVIEFSEEGRFLGVLLEGQAEASVTDDGGDKHVLARMDPGEIFGEMAMMTGGKSAADVAGVTRCTALLIPESVFSSAIAARASTVMYLSKIIVDRLSKTGTEAGMEDVADAASAASAVRRSGDPYGFKLRTDAPMKLLVVNCGSSSLKYDLFDTFDERANANGVVEKIGEEGTHHTHRSAKGEAERTLPRGGHAEAFAAMVEALSAKDTGVLRSLGEVSAVGHRVVHGGSRYSHQVIITDDVIREIEQASEWAPLHNPANLTGIREAQRLFPDVPHVAVFDTAFHQVMPAYAYLYGLPYEYFEQKGIRRYGFHGISHKYVSLKAAEFLERPFNELETIVCHLGNGASVCAIDHGRSVDTSMGLTPTEGLIMGTRCGDIDPGILLHLMRTDNLDSKGLHELINKVGGLKGISGVSNDMREIEAAADAGNPRALLAVKTFCYRVRKYIGAYVAAMGSIDAIAFTGGIGQGSAWVRSLACQGLATMGIRIDERKNRDAKGFDQIGDITADGSPVRVLVIPTDEERMIARETLRALQRSHVATILRSQPPPPIPIEISAHHVHLSQEHVDALFGTGYQLTAYQELSQPGQYACNEKVNLIGPRGRVENVRILGPARKQTQVEIAMTEQFKLGITPPIRESGSLEGTPGITIEAAKGAITIDKGVICALRHIHMTPDDALRMGLKDKDTVTVRAPGDRELIFGDVLIRVSPNYRLAMHLDTDEGNAGNITTGMIGYIDGIQSRR